MITPTSGDTSRWLAAMSAPAMKMSAHVNVMRSGVVVADLPLETGSVTMNRTAAVRRSCNLTLTPVGATSLDLSWQDNLAAAGNEVRPWWQITYSDGSTDEVPLGTFTIVETAYADSGIDLTVKVNGYDRSWLMQQNKLMAPYTVQAGMPVELAIQDLIASNWTGDTLSFNITPSGHSTPAVPSVVRPGKTVWSQALTLAASIGYELFIDPLGTVTGWPVPDSTAQAPVATLTALSRSGLKTATAKSTRKGVYSAFGVIGSGSVSQLNKAGTKMISKTVPIYASAYDTNPASPTYYLGAFGTVAQTIRSTMVSTQAQAQAVAAGYLANQQGAMTGATFGIIPLPLLDAYDVVSVTPGRVAAAGLYVVDGWTATMHYDASMDLTVRQVF